MVLLPATTLAPITPVISGSRSKPRWPLARSSNGWLSVVPRKLAAVVPLLPVVRQKPDALTPPSVAAFTPVNPAPLPVKLLPALLSETALE